MTQHIAAPPPGYTPPAIPADEEARLAELERTGLLDSPPAEAFGRITRSVAELLKVPIALISLVDRDRQWFLSRFGLDVSETPREVSLCGHVVARRETLHVPDTEADARFAGNPLVTGEPHLRAYLGVPLRGAQGRVLGTLCVLDRRPRAFTADEQQALARYASALEQMLRR